MTHGNQMLGYLKEVTREVLLLQQLCKLACHPKTGDTATGRTETVNRSVAPMEHFLREEVQEGWATLRALLPPDNPCRALRNGRKRALRLA